MLELKNIQKSFSHNGNAINILKGLDLSVLPGESIAVTGASGVGKSTLLNIMGVLEPPTEGVVLLDGKDVNQLTSNELCGLRNKMIGFVFQFHHLLSELNTQENTMMPARIAGLDVAEAAERACDILGKVGLSDRLDHRVGELSGGEQQRVAIARALVMKPRLLLADETTGNLDRITGDRIIDLLIRLKKEEGLSMVMATHNQRITERMSRRLEIVDGQIQKRAR